jgi:23S rRNA (adenine2503-C2)-methyltransferase
MSGRAGSAGSPGRRRPTAKPQQPKAARPKSAPSRAGKDAKRGPLPSAPLRRGARPPGTQRTPPGATPHAVQRTAQREPPEQDRSPRAMLTLYRPDIARFLSEGDCASYRYAQAYLHLFQRPARAFSEATALPADARAALDALGASTLAQIEDQTAADGTTKLLLSTRDGMYIESVVMRYTDRVTVCISSQVGCPVGCTFCATGSMGFRRNLSAAEIVDQVRAAATLADAEKRRVSNIVYMGMGEPLLNLQAVLDSISILTDPNGFGLSHRAISVSTVGLPNGMRRLARTEPQVNLALSLHAADDATRSRLVPERYRHPVADVLDAAWDHFSLTHRKLLIEYVLINGINDSSEHARALARLLRGHVVAVNLLSWNPVARLVPVAQRATEGRQETTGLATSQLGHFQPSSSSAVAAFREVLVGSHIDTVVRRSKGGSIQGACGQLAGRRRAATVVRETEPGRTE